MKRACLKARYQSTRYEPSTYTASFQPICAVASTALSQLLVLFLLVIPAPPDVGSKRFIIVESFFTMPSCFVSIVASAYVDTLSPLRVCPTQPAVAFTSQSSFIVLL